MSNLLFIELGAAVTQILDPHKCNIEPFCGLIAPTYNDSSKWFTVDFAQSLVNLQNEDALYDEIVSPMVGRRVAIGQSWPGGCGEGILCVRYHFVTQHALLGPAAQLLGSSPCPFQVITSIGGAVPVRYHGFLAQYNSADKSLQISSPQSSKPFTISDYDPTDSTRFYVGSQVDGYAIPPPPTQSGPAEVFINVAEFPGLEDELPKLPKSAGL